MKFYKDIELHDQSFRIRISYYGNGQMGFSGWSLNNTTEFKCGFAKIFDSHPSIEKHGNEIISAYNQIVSECTKHAEKCRLQEDLKAMLISDLSFCVYPKEGLY